MYFFRKSKYLTELHTHSTDLKLQIKHLDPKLQISTKDFAVLKETKDTKGNLLNLLPMDVHPWVTDIWKSWKYQK